MLRKTAHLVRFDIFSRDFDEKTFNQKKDFFKKIIKNINSKYDKICTIEIKDEYKNIIYKRRNRWYKTLIYGIAMSSSNVFTDVHNFHGPFEFISLESIQKAVDVIIEITKITLEINEI